MIQGGDLIDNDQANELASALAVLHGGARQARQRAARLLRRPVARPTPTRSTTAPTSTRRATRAAAARRTAASPAPASPRRGYPVLGDHDILVAGEIAPTAQTRGAGRRRPGGVGPPARSDRCRRGSSRGPAAVGLSPDGPPSPGLVDHFLAQALAAPKVRVPADPGPA